MPEHTPTKSSGPDPDQAPPTYRVSVAVRDLVDFALRSGGLAGEQQFVPPSRALQGTRAHQLIQQSRPEGYQSELLLSFQITRPELVLTIKGRIDGLLQTPETIVLEEIKTVTASWTSEPDPLHWAQAKVYGWILASQQQLPGLEIQLTYVNLDTGASTLFRERFTTEYLAAFFESVANPYVDWLREQAARWTERDRSIAALAFPFPSYRAGQRQLAVAAYRTFGRTSRLLAEAPTGIGKTVSLLFAAIKRFTQGTKIFFLTAKTPGKEVAESAVAELRKSGLRMRTVTLTAKEKLCVTDGKPCDVRFCPRATGYYDRYKPALRAGFERETLTRTDIEQLAQEFQVCPYALALDFAAWADLIICDYNYALDPKVYLRRFFADTASDECLLLIDEAHNLVDRARDMFSASLSKAEFGQLKERIGDMLPACTKAIGKIVRAWNKLEPGPAKELPNSLIAPLERFHTEAEQWLIRNQPSEFNELLLNLYFRVTGFLRTAEIYDENFVSICDSERSSLRLYCVNPATLLRESIGRARSVVFFSATLRPMDYFGDLFGAGDNSDSRLQLPSPFPRENFRVLVASRIGTQWKQRAHTSEQVCQAIAALVRAKLGNYLVYFPSYQYLSDTLPQFRNLYPELEVVAQIPAMTEPDRERFVRQFQSKPGRTLVGFAVLGGIFAEGIDLPGDRLSGAVVVGVGLPQLCLERDLIRDHFEERTGAGFDYAYVYPGIQRVLQAVGRVIRTETDRGIALLIDTRFGQSRYRELLPAWWSCVEVASPAAIAEAAEAFWSSPFTTSNGFRDEN